MKRWIHASTNMSDIRNNISSKLFDYIRYELWPQKDYYKQIRKQFTVNGRRYTIKNTSKGTLDIINPEGENLYGYSIPNSISQDITDEMAASIINDAYGDDTDLENKEVNLNIRRGYTSYGRNSSGKVVFGPYVAELRRYGGYQKGYHPELNTSDINARYISLQIKAWWSSHDEYLFFSDDKSELIQKAKKFVQDGSNTSSIEDSMGERIYRFYADVIDTETGEEIYFDKSESKPL